MPLPCGNEAKPAVTFAKLRAMLCAPTVEEPECCPKHPAERRPTPGQNSHPSSKMKGNRCTEMSGWSRIGAVDVMEQGSSPAQLAEVKDIDTSRLEQRSRLLPMCLMSGFVHFPCRMRWRQPGYQEHVGSGYHNFVSTFHVA